MYEIVQKLHSGWAYLALLVLVIAVVNSIIGLSSKKEFTEKEQENCAICLGSHTHSIGDWFRCLFCFSSRFFGIGSNERCGFATDFVGTSACQHYWYRLITDGLVETQKTGRE